MNEIKNVLIFAAGAIVGGIVTWRIAKRTYAKIAQDEINLYKKNLEDKFDNYVKETSAKKSESKDEVKEEKEPLVEPDDDGLNYEVISDEDEDEDDACPEPRYIYNSYLDELEYINSKAGKDKAGTSDAPYIINEADIGDRPEYDLIGLTFYADHILTDDANLPIKDIDEIVGPEALRCFLNEQVNCVYVRNERLGCDFEILRDLKRYADVKDKDKWRSNDE